MKTILVPYHDTRSAEAAIASAVLVAHRFGGYLEGLLVREGPHLGFGERFNVPPEYLSDVAKQWRVFADMAREQFIRIVRDRGLPVGELESESDGPVAGWREIEGAEGSVVGEYGRLFDLIVIGRSQDESVASWQETCESALFESGRPVLVANGRGVERIGDTIVVAWNGSTEAARTVAHAMPFLKEAKRVVVLTVEGGMMPGPHGRDLAAHLSRDGIAAEALTIDPAGLSVGEAIIDEAERQNADLLVKGAFTRSRLRQVIFGGATQHILSYAPLPVLMAH